MEIISNNSIKSILNENKKCIEIKSDKIDANNEFSKKNEQLRSILKKEILEDELYKEQKKEIDTLQHQFNELKTHTQVLDDFQKEIINKLNSNFINCINDKFEEIKKYLNEQINININKQLEEILNHIKNKETKIINKCIKNKDIIKKDMEPNIKDIKKAQNELNFEKVKKNSSKNIDNSNYNYNKEFNNRNQVKNNYATNQIKNNYGTIKKRNSNNYIVNKNENNLLTENQINEKKIENKVDKEPLTGSIILNKYSNNGENIRNSAIFSDEEECKPYNLNELNTFRKNYNNCLNIGDNYLSNKNKIDYEKKQKEGDFKIKYKNDKSKISNKENDSNNQKLYQSINFIFFHDYQQKFIKDQKISEFKKEELKKQIFNDKKKGSNILKDYYMNYIETIILPLFKKKIILLLQN